MRSLREELKWTFTRPMTWLQGVGINLVLAFLYLLIWPLSQNAKYDTVLLFCVYFGTFIMADITTTNIFGPDLKRTYAKLAAGESFARILLRKNAVQALVVMLPMVLITWAWTEYLYMDAEMLRTIPGVLYPMLLFLGIGNVISVLFVVPSAGLGWRLKNWRQWRWHLPELVSYAIPFGIYGLWVYTDLPGTLNLMLKTWGQDIMVLPSESAQALMGASLFLYGSLTICAVFVFKLKGLQIWGETNLPYWPSNSRQNGESERVVDA